MSGKYVEMTYLWEKDISFFTSESPSLVCRTTFEDWRKESIICMWKPFKNPVWKFPQGHFFWYPEAKSWEMAMEGQLWWPSVERSWSGQSASARHLPGSPHVTTVCSWEPGTLLGKNLPWVVRGLAQGQAPNACLHPSTPQSSLPMYSTLSWVHP